ncbi:MAG: PqiC family protein [Pseudomonadota bacterium]
MAFGQKCMLATALLLLAACRSEPIQFHTLIPVQPGGYTESGGTDIQIEAISVPPQVDRQQIVIRQSTSSLAVLETQWWGASLIDEMRSALVDQLLTSSTGRKVSVRVDVQRFDSIPGQHALIDVKWRLRNVGAGDNTLLTCRSILKTPTGASIDEIVIAHQNNLKRLASEINQAAGSTVSACPSKP